MSSARHTPPQDAWAGGHAPHRPQKRWGQHFLTNRGILQRILDAAELAPGDDVVEVGPGRGVLTKELVQRAGRVLAVEIDRVLAERLRVDMAEHDTFALVQDDILDYPPERLLPLFPNADQHPPDRYLVVANLPYNVAAPTLRLFLESDRRPARLVVMVQREVAQNMCAKPGDMGLLSVGIQFYGSARIVAKVPPGSFSPPPKVDSAVVRIDTYDKPPIDVPTPAAFFETVRAGFAAPRKQIRNALAQGMAMPTADALTLLTDAGIDGSRRAETLSLDEWARLSRVRAGGR